MVIRRLVLCIFLLAAGAWPARVLGADQAFAHNYLTGSKQIVRFPVGNPVAMNVVGPLTDSLAGMDFDPAANVLWAINITTQSLGTVDRSSGAFTTTVALQGDCCINALTIDPVSGTFYVSKGDAYVYSLDPSTGATTLLAAAAPAGAQITALAMDCNARLFALDGTANSVNLYLVHLAGSPTLIGSPGLAKATSLEFDNDNGTLYGWFNDTGSDVSTHATVDTATAQLSQTSQLSGRYRMAVRNTCFRIFASDFES